MFAIGDCAVSTVDRRDKLANYDRSKRLIPRRKIMCGWIAAWRFRSLLGIGGIAIVHDHDHGFRPRACSCPGNHKESAPWRWVDQIVQNKVHAPLSHPTCLVFARPML